MQGVRPVDKLKGRLKEVIAVGSPPNNVQEKVELGRGGDVVKGLHTGQEFRPPLASQNDAEVNFWQWCDAPRRDAALVELAEVNLPTRCFRGGAGEPLKQR